MNDRKKLLLHTCCGTCGAWIPQMLAQDFAVDLFYFNPNIHPREEYARRLADVEKVAEALNLKLIADEYDPRAWFGAVRDLIQEPEGGKRCPVCFELRLRRTAEYAREHGYDCFATNLTIGRNKRADVINPMGERLAVEYGVEFLARDFKKQAGFEKSCRHSDTFGVVRQNYCGCVYSRLERLRYKKSPD